MVVQLLILALLLLFIPAFLGSIFANVDKDRGNLLLRWISGQVLLWAGFQLISVPLILKQVHFEKLVSLFWVYIAAVLIFAVGAGIRRRARSARAVGMIRGYSKKNYTNAVLWVVFLGLLLFQLVQAVRMAYADGDDAYYVAISSITQESDTMYLKLPYTGGATELDVRHGLAPFPIWIAFLGKVSGMQAVTVAQVVLPVVLITMTYTIFYLIGSRLFPAKNGQLPLFMIFTALLVLFGDYSFSTAENFMIARSSQGKAVLGSIVIPFMLLLLLILMKKLQEKEPIPVGLYGLVCATAVTGCLCSTLGALLICMTIGIAGVLGAVCYKRFRILIPLALCCAPCVFYALLYLVLE